MKLQLTGALPSIGVNTRKIYSNSGKNDEKFAKSDFIKPMQKLEELSFITPNAK